MSDGVIVIFGASGDLAKRKIFPAIFQLLRQEKLKNIAIVGAAIDTISVDQMLDPAKEFIELFDDALWKQLKKRSFYQQLKFDSLDDFIALGNLANSLEKKFNFSGNRFFYMAAASQYFCSITDNIGRAKLALRKAKGQKPWHRIVYEKPFGHDLESAHQINECIAEWFDEHQIYRIDHYLTKELVSNITLVRFTNCVFEPLWNNRFIDQVQIILSEEMGVEDRGSYYDSYGALRDVVQNHMLELLALIGMEAPEKLAGDFIRAQRAHVLAKVRVVDGMLGQYRGYKNTPGVDPKSTTDTFAALYLTVDNPRWSGVPFYLKTGKLMEKKETAIHIKFKQVDCLMLKHCPTPSNWLTITISPEATFSLQLNAKKPSSTDELVPIAMEFCHSCIFGLRQSESYELVFEEVIRGEQSVSVRFDEIESAWRIIDEVRAKKYPLHIYEPKSMGPTELQNFEKKHGMRWKS